MWCHCRSGAAGKVIHSFTSNQNTTGKPLWKLPIPDSVLVKRSQLLLGFLADHGFINSVQSPSRVWLFETPWTAARQACLSITNSRSLLKLISIELLIPSNHLILYHPLLLPSIFPSIRVFSNESTLCIMWPKYWSFSFSISPSNVQPGLISFRMDWSDTRPFKYDLNQIPYDYTVEVRNRFKGLDRIDRVPDELWTEVCDIVQRRGLRPSP